MSAVQGPLIHKNYWKSCHVSQITKIIFLDNSNIDVCYTQRHTDTDNRTHTHIRLLKSLISLQECASQTKRTHCALSAHLLLVPPQQVVLQYLPTYLTPGLLVPPPLPSVFPSWLTPHIPFPFTKSSLLLYQEVFLSPGINLIFDLKLFFAVLETESRASQVFYHLSYYIVFSF